MPFSGLAPSKLKVFSKKFKGSICAYRVLSIQAGQVYSFYLRGVSPQNTREGPLNKLRKSTKSGRTLKK